MSCYVYKCPTQAIDPRVAQKIKDLRGSGVRTVG